MFRKYLQYKRIGHIPVFGMGLIPLTKGLMFLGYKDAEEFLMPNGRLAKCRMVHCYKNDTGNIIHVMDRDNEIIRNEMDEYFYVYNFYNYIGTPKIKDCSFKEFKTHYASLLFPELDGGEYLVMNALTGYKPGDRTERVLGVWTKECEEKWGGKDKCIASAYTLNI